MSLQETPTPPSNIDFSRHRMSGTRLVMAGMLCNLSEAYSSVRDTKGGHTPVIEGVSSAAMEQNSAADADLRGVPAEEISNMESTKSKWPECLTVSITLKRTDWYQVINIHPESLSYWRCMCFVLSWWCLWMLQDVKMVNQQNTIPLKRSIREGWLRTRLSCPRINHLRKMPKVTTRLWYREGVLQLWNRTLLLLLT